MNRLLADNSHQMSILIWFLKEAANLENAVCCKLSVAPQGLNIFCPSQYQATLMRSQFEHKAAEHQSEKEGE